MGWQALKIYDPNGKLTGSLEHVKDAAAVMLVHEAGATVRFGYNKRETIFVRGVDSPPMDDIVRKMIENMRLVGQEAERREALRRERHRKSRGYVV